MYKWSVSRILHEGRVMMVGLLLLVFPPMMGYCASHDSTNQAVGLEAKAAVGPSLWYPPLARTNHISELLAFELDTGVKTNWTGFSAKANVLAFVYSRCESTSKCSRTMASLRVLQERLNVLVPKASASINVLTYDPEFDSAEHLKKYARRYGFRLGQRAHMIRCSVAARNELVRSMGLQVGFGEREVLDHRVELFIVDSAGFVAREYRTLFWKIDDVLADLTRLQNE